jgi:hypothetical protein
MNGNLSGTPPLDQPAHGRPSIVRPTRARSIHPAQRGFALLLVFALAGSIAILFYLAIPRVAFEHQRDKEALLVDRGEQFQRAIELHVRRLNRLPQSLDDLEQKAPNMRFLRRRYTDPMSGSDEWRLVHLNAAGQYVDSKVHNPPISLGQNDSGSSPLASNVQGIGDAATVTSPAFGNLAPGLQLRASDHIPPGSALNAGGEDSAGNNSEPGLTGGAILLPGAMAGAPVNLNASGSFVPAVQRDPFGAPSTAGLPGATSSLDAQPAANSGLAGAPFSAQGAEDSQAQAGQLFLNAQNGAPGAAPGGAFSLRPAVPCVMGGGVVGVASTIDQQGIRIYKHHSNYSEWEFLYEQVNPQGVYQPCQGSQNANYRGAPGVALGGPGNAAPTPGLPPQPNHSSY